MSNIIEMPLFNNRSVMQFQQSRNLLIDASELAGFCSRGQVSLIGASCAGIKSLGDARSLLIVSPAILSRATSAILIDDLKDHASDEWRRWSSTAYELLQCQHEALQWVAPIDEVLPNAAARIRVERLATIQAGLGLSILDLANVLKISRQGLYKWLDGSSDAKLQDANRKRLAAVERIAKQWCDESTTPLSVVAKETLANGNTVFAMMSADDIEEAAVISSFPELKNMLADKPKTRSQKLADAGFQRRPSFKSLPTDE